MGDTSGVLADSSLSAHLADIGSIIALTLSVLTIIGIAWRQGGSAAKLRDEVTTLTREAREFEVTSAGDRARLHSSQDADSKLLLAAVALGALVAVGLIAAVLRLGERLRLHEDWAREELTRLRSK